MQNLRDKLLKAGLVSEQEVRKSEEPAAALRQRKPEPLKKKETATAPAAKPIPRLPPLALPGSKAFQRLEALKQQETQKRLRELVYATQVAVEPGAHSFHFVTRKGKLRRMEISEPQAKALEEGALAVVERQEPAMIEHSLVPAKAAEEILTLNPKAVRFFNKEGAPIGFSEEAEPEDAKPQGDEAD